eukprot:6201552-Pleurochrysis_carterae.AAC.1
MSVWRCDSSCCATLVRGRARARACGGARGRGGRDGRVAAQSAARATSSLEARQVRCWRILVQGRSSGFKRSFTMKTVIFRWDTTVFQLPAPYWLSYSLYKTTTTAVLLLLW